MELARLRTFREVARCGGIAAAARRVGSDPSSVSRAIAALETDLGVRLLQRTTRRLELTEVGTRYLDRIEPLLDDLEAAREEALGSTRRPSGRLRVTASSAYGQTILAPMLRSFCNSYPDIDIELLLTDALVDLVAERVDVGLRLGPQPTGDLVVSRLATTAMRAVASPDYLERSTKLSTPDAIEACDCLIASMGRNQIWLFRRGGAEKAIEVAGRVASSNTLALRRCAIDGIGIAVLPDWLVESDIVDGRLSVVLPDWHIATGTFETGVWIIYPSRNYLPFKARVFIDHLRTMARDAGGT